MVDVKLLKRNPRNVKMHTMEQIKGIAKLITFIGWRVPIAIDKKTYTIYAGHGAFDAAVKILHMKQVPCIDISRLSTAEKEAYMIMDNKINESDWNVQNLTAVLNDITPEIKLDDFHIDFTDVLRPQELDNLQDEHRIGGLEENTRAREEVTIPNKAPKRTKLGDLWALGPHFLLCGDATLAETKSKLFKNYKISSICTDPPYSSGGRQEAHKSGGSIGSKRIVGDLEVTPKIKMDDLSTRGYLNLIKSTLYGVDADILYMFTDWRMWDWTREASEAAGFPVRNMIVWDKQTPGMGIQWRGQHELICFAKRTTLGGPFHKGNVLTYARSGNKHHPTEKPVPLLMELIENTKGETVYDPFAGSGSTLFACDKLDKRCLLMELDPLFCDVILKRYEDYSKNEVKKL